MGFKRLRDLMKYEAKPEERALALVQKQDEKVAFALAKRDSGQTLTRSERILLAAEDAGMTPEHQMAVLQRVSTRPGRNSIAQVNAVNAAAALVGDDAEAKNSKGNQTINIALGSLWATASSDDGRSEEVREVSPLGITVDPTQVDD